MFGESMTTDKCGSLATEVCKFGAGTLQASYCAKGGAFCQNFCAWQQGYGISDCAADADCMVGTKYVIRCSSVKAMVESHCDGVDSATLAASLSVLHSSQRCGS
jgi:hypothetical protein